MGKLHPNKFPPLDPYGYGSGIHCTLNQHEDCRLTPNQAKKIKGRYNYRVAQLRDHKLGVRWLAPKVHARYIAECTALAQKLLAAGYRLGFGRKCNFYVYPIKANTIVRPTVHYTDRSFGGGWWWMTKWLAAAIMGLKNLSWVKHHSKC